MNTNNPVNRLRTTPAGRWLALLLCVLLAAPGCATTGTTPAPAPATERDLAVLGEYVQKLRPGSTVRIDLVDGRDLRGTLMKATAQQVVVQLRTRVPEPPLEIALTDLLRIAPETGNGSNVGKMIGIGVAAGGAAALAFFMILFAVFSD
jgi:hypothetical protein